MRRKGYRTIHVQIPDELFGTVEKWAAAQRRTVPKSIECLMCTGIPGYEEKRQALIMRPRSEARNSSPPSNPNGFGPQGCFKTMAEYRQALTASCQEDIEAAIEQGNDPNVVRESYMRTAAQYGVEGWLAPEVVIDKVEHTERR